MLRDLKNHFKKCFKKIFQIDDMEIVLCNINFENCKSGISLFQYSLQSLPTLSSLGCMTLSLFFFFYFPYHIFVFRLYVTCLLLFYISFFLLLFFIFFHLPFFLFLLSIFSVYTLSSLFL